MNFVNEKLNKNVFGDGIHDVVISGATFDRNINCTEKIFRGENTYR